MNISVDLRRAHLMDEVMLERQMACVPSISELRCMFWIKLSFLMLHSLHFLRCNKKLDES